MLGGGVADGGGDMENRSTLTRLSARLVVVPLVTLALEQIKMEINNENCCDSPSLCLAFFVSPRTIRDSFRVEDVADLSVPHYLVITIRKIVLCMYVPTSSPKG